MKNPLRLIVLGLVIALVVYVIVIGIKSNRARVIPDGQALSVDLGNGVMLDLVRIREGSFEMGSSESEPGHDASESPRRVVKITKSFFIGKLEVTQGQWQAVMNYNQAQSKGQPTQAVDSVGRLDALKFCKYASEKTGRTVRLPTEAEWEYACRAGTDTAFAFGDDLKPEDAVFNWRKADPKLASPSRPASGGSKRANAWGLYDMHGNLWEWCADVFEPDYSNHPATQGALETRAPDASYVYRGGSWRSAPQECRSAIRFAGPSDLRSDVMGFRVVIEPR